MNHYYKNPTRCECNKCKKLSYRCDCNYKCDSITITKAYKKDGITDNRNQRIK